MMAGFDLKTLMYRLDALTVFRGLLQDPVVAGLADCLHASATEGDGSDKADRTICAYATFISRLYEAGYVSIGAYLTDAINRSENIYIRLVGQKLDPPAVIRTAIEQELITLNALCRLSREDICGASAGENADIGYLPGLEVSECDLLADYREQAENVSRRGYGMYAEYRMFYLDEDGSIRPVKYPDATRLSDLIGYERQKEVIITNTRALLQGLTASNILLTGDAGTGKSSTVKAVVNELYAEGLRILEVRKEQLHLMPAIMDELAVNPLKFIIFVDDLSFNKSDDHFSALKAILEGSVSARPANVVIYATSNRRHLVKENFGDREGGDDIHRNDTMQETLSLSERFGIHLTFSKPDKKVYLDIVHHLAAERGLRMAEEELDLLSERFALARGSRSARAAKQFIDNLCATNGI